MCLCSPPQQPQPQQPEFLALSSYATYQGEIDDTFRAKSRRWILVLTVTLIVYQVKDKTRQVPKSEAVFIGFWDRLSKWS